MKPVLRRPNIALHRTIVRFIDIFLTSIPSIGLKGDFYIYLLIKTVRIQCTQY